ncbi:hypothetical protein D6T65_07785 [Arthrobacter frigidicola]|nr:hypothetical protein D6T65_07785 [Arthrobacter frigidicola]
MSSAGGYDPAPVPASGPGLSVRGGVGGIRFQWEELDRAAAELGGLAEAVREVSAALVYLSLELERTRLAAGWLPGGRDAGAAGRAVAEALDAARRRTSDSGDELQETADRITRARLAYLAADTAARLAVFGATESVELSARAAAAAAAREGLLVPGPLALTAPAEVEQVAFGGTLEAIADRLAAVEAAPPGSFEILSTDGPAGPVYLVILPGTQPAEPGNPFDATGIAEAVNEDSRYVGAAVAQALREAGARPGETVLLAGYSQGGMHAMNLAAGGAVGGTYDVRLVVTLGSPTGWEPTGAAEYLHLEHAADTVPALDGGPAPDEPNRVTVRAESPVPALPAGPGAEGKGLGAAHKLATYAQAAALVDSSDLPSLAPAAAALAAIGGGAQRRLYRAVRHPAEHPAAAGPGSSQPTGRPGPPAGVPVPRAGEGPAGPGPAGPPPAARR